MTAELDKTSAGTAGTAGTFSTAISYRRSTKYTDAESGLIYFGYRLYHSGTGSWLTRDPLMETGGLNLYSIVNNDPITRIDALGLSVFGVDDYSWDFNIVEHNHNKEELLWDVSGYNFSKCEFFFNAKKVFPGEWFKYVNEDVIEITLAGPRLADDMKALQKAAGKAKYDWDYVSYGKHGSWGFPTLSVVYTFDGRHNLSFVQDQIAKVTITCGTLVVAICEGKNGVWTKPAYSQIIPGHGSIDRKNCKIYWQSSVAKVTDKDPTLSPYTDE